MPLIVSSPVALPLIDSANPVKPAQLSAADALIRAEIDETAAAGALHPRLPQLRETRFTPLIEQEHARIAAGAPKSTMNGECLDLSRYELPSAPEADLDSAEKTAAWTAVLRQSYTSAQYLSSRETNLSLLEAYGKNAWLIGNDRLESELRALEKEVEGKARELEEVQRGRRDEEERARPEMDGLQEGWRVGVGRMLETLAAAEGLRRDILKEKSASG